MAESSSSAQRAHRQCDITRKTNAYARRARVCEQCRKDFIEGKLSKAQREAGHRARFCSNACRAASQQVYASKAEAKRAEYARARERKGLHVAPVDHACCECSAAFSSKAPNAIRCEPCRKVKSGPRPKVTRACEGCGTTITGTAAKRQCRSVPTEEAASLQEAPPKGTQVRS